MPACVQGNQVQTVSGRGVWHCLYRSPSPHRKAVMPLCWWSWRVDKFWCSVHLLSFLMENFTLLGAGGGIVSCKGILGIPTQMEFSCPTNVPGFSACIPNLREFCPIFYHIKYSEAVFSEDFPTLVPPVLSLLPSTPASLTKSPKHSTLISTPSTPEIPKPTVYTHLRWFTRYFFRASWFRESPYSAFPQHCLWLLRLSWVSRLCFKE